MQSRTLALVGVLALGLLPALGVGQDPAQPPAPTPPGGVTHVKAEAHVIGVEKDAEGRATVKLETIGGIQWPGENVDARSDATALAGAHVRALLAPGAEIFVADRPAGIEALANGAKGKFLLRTTCSPVAPTCAFDLLKAYVAGTPAPKPPVGPKAPIEPQATHGFELGFFPRLWTLRGDVLGVEKDGEKVIVNVDVRRLVNQMKRFNDEGRRLARLDAYVVIGPKTVVTDEDGDRIAAKDLAVDASVKVIGKFLKPEKWVIDETEEKVPTLVAKRVKVVDAD